MVGEVGYELRMALQRPRPLTYREARDRAVAARGGRDDARVGRHVDDLVLVARDERDPLERRIHAGQRVDDVVLLHADAPTTGRARDLAAECLREELVPEADADVPVLLGDDLAVQLFGVGDPVDVVVGREPARRADPAVALRERVGEAAFVEVVRTSSMPNGANSAPNSSG